MLGWLWEINPSQANLTQENTDMLGKEIPTNPMRDIEIIQELNKLSNAELLTFIQSTSDKRLQKVANNLYRNRFIFQPSQNSTQNIVDEYLNSTQDIVNKYLNW